MRIRLTATARASYDAAPSAVRKAFDKSAVLLARSLRHPSLRAKKYDEANDVWQARINSDWRFYFQIAGDVYIIHKIIPHPKSRAGGERILPHLRQLLCHNATNIAATPRNDPKGSS